MTTTYISSHEGTRHRTTESAPAFRAPASSALQSYWDARAAAFDAEDPWNVARAEPDWRAVLRDVLGEGPLFVLDAGFGTGALALVLNDLGHVVRGVDVSTQMQRVAIEKARRRGIHIDLECAYAEDLPYADASLDVVVARHVLWDMPAPDRAVHEWMRVLRPGGRIVVVETRWITEPAGALQRALRKLVPAAGALDFPTPGGARGALPAPDACQAKDYLASMGLQRTMVLDLAWLRNASWATLPRTARALTKPRSLHYAAWGVKV